MPFKKIAALVLDTAWVRFLMILHVKKIPLNPAGVAEELRKVESGSVLKRNQL